MFGELLTWAGEFRQDERSPGGAETTQAYLIPMALRAFTDDLRAWVAALPADPSLEEIAGIVADAHHGFQKIHPFKDTNGRTGRVLDLYLLWVTFGLKRASVTSSPTIEPFPTAPDEDEYYGGLQEADTYRPERLRKYYLARLRSVFAAP